MDVIQEVEYVKQEAKMVYLLECLQKTPPPVIIFSDNKNEVDGEWSDTSKANLQTSRSTFFSKASKLSRSMEARVSP